MLDFLEGTVEYKSIEPYSCTMSVSGLGMRVLLTSRDWNPLPMHESQRLFTSMHYNAENIKIYGFSVPTDRDIFELLVSVKGIAGKSAMAILDTLSPRDIFTAIKDDNYEIFSTAQGIGKKTAQRIVFELKPKLQIIASLLAQSDTEPDSRVTIYSDALLELQETLLSLGYSRAETVHTLQRTLPRYAEGQEEDFLRVCLEELAK